MSVLVNRSVGRTLFSMALPMLAGTFAMNAYNLTDTWFVSRLGTLSLAAMGFTFPVVMLLTCVARGIGSGVTTLASHAIGSNDHDRAVRLVTHGFMLTLAVTAVMSIGGYLSIGLVFTRLGADEATLPLIGKYMRTWFLGALFMTLPMAGSGVLISAGDSKAASMLMIVGTVLNTILDPIMIFGFLGCPAMGIRGAALATIISQGVSTVWLVHLLHRRHRLLAWRSWRLSEYVLSLRQIMEFAVPSVLSMILMPVSASVITRLLSHFGNEAVAAAGAAGRVEMFAFIIPMALGISLTPFVSQNVGAARLDRVRQAKTLAVGFALGYGGLATAVFFLSAPWLATLFTDDPEVARTFVAYTRIIAFGYGMMEVHRYCGFFLTGLHKPLSATVLNAIRVLVLLLPLSWLGAQVWGLEGVFWGRLATDFTVGAIGLTWLSHAFRAITRDKAA
ncbi:MAG TPA: MATE family efflux transporter [Candidatus Hydrogenedentes bacterium]|jgi:putative MATE family efflux protein|nr:MATE family efflux transporter [Candidatus Hydrogenedentota bacterium]HPV35807.1 MATE family efflux transporter [Candidatus Hydrogenedentota bacterium]HQE76160.1 MATE family efflux transporter [Candidatus Hydrogenedentota bacterium]